MPRSHGHPRELLGGYVLGALERREAARVRRHLRRCRECRTTYERFANLPPLIDLLEPSEEGVPEPPRVAGDPARERAGWRRWPWRRQPPLHWTLAAIVVLTGALAAAGSLRSDDPRLTIRLTGATATATVRLAPTVSGTRVWLRGKRLAPTRSDEVYEVWFVRGGRRTSAGTFTVGASGRADVELTTASRAGDYDAIDITHERLVPDDRPGLSVLHGSVRH